MSIDKYFSHVCLVV